MINNDYTKTLVGTPHYMAPEIIMGKGYSFSSDFWAIGVTLYHLFYGYMPFGNGSKDIKEVYDEILNKYSFIFNFRNIETSLVSIYSEINSFFKAILNKCINQRVKNFTLLSKNSIFSDFDIVKNQIKNKNFIKLM